MRLGAILLIAASLAAQDATNLAPAQKPSLPGAHAPTLPWRSAPVGPTATTGSQQPSSGPMRVILDSGGGLKILDARGIVWLRTGLRGRPIRVWRDGGIPIGATSGTWGFPDRTPLSQGIGGLPLGQVDFRPGLQGLLWILDDEERILTVVHPATTRIAYLALPTGTGLELVFLPDALWVVQNTPETSRLRSYWSLPWLSLLPQFIALGSAPKPEKPGTALVPFPNS
ncbi:MAG: hypothetical protein Q8O00_12820 [Holophaga sp.]|nr:hypothetical protein [Holophaga sp.]